MLRVIFDTNIYGWLLLERDKAIIEEKMRADKDLIIYGYRLVRWELRNTSTATPYGRKKRIELLKSYDNLTNGHQLQHAEKIAVLAKQYYDHYRACGGICPWDSNIKIDFMIAACASIHALDIVYSADERTLLHKHAMQAYQDVNKEEGLKNPAFMHYKTLIRKYRNLFL